MDIYNDIAASDLKELWDTELDTMHCESMLRLSGGHTSSDPQDLHDWFTERGANDRTVILNDKLMTDALLGGAPIKHEHSYSLNGAGGAANDKRMDLEDQNNNSLICLPLQKPSHAPLTGYQPRPQTYHSLSSSHSSLSDIELDIKREPLSPHSSCPSSPRPFYDPVHPQEGPVKIEENSNSFDLPPTPPASLPSDDASQCPSPKFSGRSGYAQAARQPIHTPLISQQPKGGTGDLQLTDEEKRTLLAEGYAVPHRMPLTKAEEKSLKKVRRKIKNKISAQESRRKKKEYMDQLERRVERLVAENGGFRQRVDTLEDENQTLIGQLQRMQQLVQRKI